MTRCGMFARVLKIGVASVTDRSCVCVASANMRCQVWKLFFYLTACAHLVACVWYWATLGGARPSNEQMGPHLECIGRRVCYGTCWCHDSARIPFIVVLRHASVVPGLPVDFLTPTWLDKTGAVDEAKKWGADSSAAGAAGVVWLRT